MKQSNPWAFFDRVYCITLADRPDRRKSAEAEFARVGLAGRVEFVMARRHPSNSEKGIYLSHLKCLRKGIDAGARVMAVFEDDVVFDRFNPAVLKESTGFLSACPGWNILFFGCLVRGSRPTRTTAVVAIDYRCLAHAYAVHRHFALALVKKPWRQSPFDAILKRFTHGYYAVYPTFAFQSDSATDNLRLKGLDRFRRLCGGLQRIQKVNEWYYRNRSLVIAAHLFLALVLVLILPLVW
ncbi:MAG: glycosyltransferase [Desulfobacterales bacterium]|nr:glycosyltransferase [Desulfobacterales bacterium]